MSPRTVEVGILVTQDLMTEILRDEEGHRRLFEGFLRECEADGIA